MSNTVFSCNVVQLYDRELFGKHQRNQLTLNIIFQSMEQKNLRDHVN